MISLESDGLIATLTNWSVLLKFRFRQSRNHSGARGEMDNLIETYFLEQVSDDGDIGQVAVNEGERAAQRFDFIEVPLLDGRAVKGVQIVQRPDGVAGLEQPFAHVRADESRAARNQKIHGRIMEREIQSSKFKVAGNSRPPTIFSL
jgi:hypothetical protein